MPLGNWFDVVKSQKLAGQRPRQGTKSCRMGRNSSIRLSSHPSICHPSKGSEDQWERSKGQPEESEGLPEE